MDENLGGVVRIVVAGQALEVRPGIFNAAPQPVRQVERVACLVAAQRLKVAERAEAFVDAHVCRAVFERRNKAEQPVLGSHCNREGDVIAVAVVRDELVIAHGQHAVLHGGFAMLLRGAHRDLGAQSVVENQPPEIAAAHGFRLMPALDETGVSAVPVNLKS